MKSMLLSLPGSRVWRISRHICAFADNERHLGHVVKTEAWHAWDATHLNESATGPRYLGAFSGLNAAKEAVQASVAGEKTMMRTLHAGSCLA
jgi:hypothetical protein